jgi:hypothetical protein
MEEEHVNRRDAVVGLSLLGGLTVLLVATIFYRIINPPAPRTISLDGMTVAADPAKTPAPLATQQPALPESPSIHRDGAVAGAAFTSDVAVEDASSGAPPTFVAPSSVR